MVFSSHSFILFLLVAVSCYWIAGRLNRGLAKYVVIAFSILFYAYWKPAYTLVLLGSIVANFALARAILALSNRRLAVWLVVAGVAANLLTLGYYKYFAFLVTTLNVFVEHPLPVPDILLPIGISFFTFQALSYVIDVYRGTFKPGRLLDFAVFLSFFPHVVAGPIVRPAEFMPQLKARHDPRHVDASRAFFLIFIGLFKKVVIANLLATEIVDAVFASPNQHSSLEALVGVYAYAIQIYADFSGYTDMAIGLALLLGFRFPQNFDSPYTSTSIQDFWRRWHMTLSRWLRDYLYIPLGGNQRGSKRTYVNLMATMLLGGLWHGAAWTFVVWGAIHGFYLSVEHWRRGRRLRLGLPDPRDTVRRRWVQRLITFNLVCFAWVFFRSESLSNAFDLLGRIIDPSHWLEPAPLITVGVLLAIAAGLVEQYVPRATWGRAMARFSYLAPAVQGVVLGAALLVTNTMGPSGVAPFIYFRF
jgi:D-alanyl-lipoteichoic acid acyltransferase DltB (MBOAT superfamily)